MSRSQEHQRFSRRVLYPTATNRPCVSRWCNKHYQRWRDTGSLGLGVRNGNVGPKSTPLEDRFRAKLMQVCETDKGCWEWPFSRTILGYGTISSGGQRGRHLMAHRLSWEFHRGPIPEGLHIDHLCRNPPCINPNHLEPVTRAMNAQRGLGGDLGRAQRAADRAARWAAQPECGNGHEFTPANTHINSYGSRGCRTCGRVRQRARRRAQRDGVSYVDPFLRKIGE